MRSIIKIETLYLKARARTCHELASRQTIYVTLLPLFFLPMATLQPWGCVYRTPASQESTHYSSPAGMMRRRQEEESDLYPHQWLSPVVGLQRILTRSRHTGGCALSGWHLCFIPPCTHVYKNVYRIDVRTMLSRVDQIVASAPGSIMHEPRAILDLADLVHFQEDFRSSHVNDSTWPHQGNTAQVTVRGGQAHQLSSIDTNSTAQWHQECFLKTADAWRQKPGHQTHWRTPIDRLQSFYNVGIRPQ